MSMFQFVPLLQADRPVGLSKMGKEEVRQVLLAGTAMALHSQKDEGMH